MKLWSWAESVNGLKSFLSKKTSLLGFNDLGTHGEFGGGTRQILLAETRLANSATIKSSVCYQS